MKLSHGILLGFVLGASAFSAGCGKKVLKATIESGIKSAFEKQSIAFKSVSCPGDRDVKAGDTFECTGELEGGKATIGVTQKNDQGHFEFDIKGFVVVESVMAGEMDKKAGKSVGLKCAQKVVVLRKGESTSCTFKVDDAEYKVDLTASDDEKSATTKVTANGQPAPATVPAPAPADTPPVEADEAAN
jgi:hypothetical protein